MAVLNLERDRCMLCGACAAVCASAALTVHETFLDIDEKKCVQCGSCVKGCPTGALALDGPVKKKRFGGMI
jgi:ferredoxin